jgi:hypothetical protein
MSINIVEAISAIVRPNDPKSQFLSRSIINKILVRMNRVERRHVFNCQAKAKLLDRVLLLLLIRLSV